MNVDFTDEQQAALEAKQRLMKAEAELIAMKGNADEETLRIAKERLRQQRELYRLEHRGHVMALGDSVVVTPDSIEVASG